MSRLFRVQGLLGMIAFLLAASGSDKDGSTCNTDASTLSPLSGLHCGARALPEDVVVDMGKQMAEESVAEPRDSVGRTPLHLAAGRKSGNSAEVASLLSASAAHTARDFAEQTPLHFAVQSGHAEATALLLEARSNLEDVDDRRRTSLHLAAYYGHGRLVQDLVNRSASLSASDQSGRSPLGLATRFAHVQAVLELLAGRADVGYRDHQDRTPLHEAASARHTLMVQLLLEGRAAPEVQDRWRRTPLHEAARSGSAEAAHLLLLYGASAEAQAQGHVTPKAEAQTFHRDQVAAVLNGEKLSSSQLCLDKTLGSVGAGVVELLSKFFRGAPMGESCVEDGK